jgi:membrane protease YdiL (CAAX protease family)
MDSQQGPPEQPQQAEQPGDPQTTGQPKPPQAQPQPWGTPQQRPGDAQAGPWAPPQQPADDAQARPWGPPQPPPGAMQPGPRQPGEPQFWAPQQPPPWGVQQSPWGVQQPPWAQAPYGMAPPRAPRVVAAPPNLPFHRLARTELHRWWRPLLGTVVLLVVGFVVTGGVLIVWEIAHGILTGGFEQPQGSQIFPNPTENLAVTLVTLGVLIPVVLLTVRLVQRRPMGSVASVLNRLRWRWLLICCLPGLGYLAISYALGLAADAVFPAGGDPVSSSGSWVGWGRFVVPALVVLCLVPFQSAAEELLFRGWLVQAIGAYSPDGAGGKKIVQVARVVLRSPWPALVISSILFVSAHGYTGWAMADIFVFAMTIGWLAIRTGGLESGIALHTLNNLLAFLLPAATGQLNGWSEQGGAPWTLLLVDVPALAFYAVTIQWLAKRNHIDSLTPSPSPELPTR